MSSKSFQGTVVFLEQVCLEPFLEGGDVRLEERFDVVGYSPVHRSEGDGRDG